MLLWKPKFQTLNNYAAHKFVIVTDLMTLAPVDYAIVRTGI